MKLHEEFKGTGNMEIVLDRKLAEQIIAAQQTENATMRNRLEILRAGPDPNPGGYPALEGTRGPAAGTTPSKP